MNPNITKVNAAREEYSDWCEAVGISTLEELNDCLEAGRAVELINLCEARQERKYAEAANQIWWKRDKCRIVLMSGPSSSGKTSSSLRIAQQCRVLGLHPKVVELDNYFVDREHTPRDAEGNYDFESLDAMDIGFLNSQLRELLDGREIELPTYDFKSGTRTFTGKTLRLGAGDILMMEGIHGLDPALTPSIDQEDIFHVYISALSSLPGGEKVHSSTTDKRLLRRIVRDNRTRGISPEENILRWQSVRRGEELYIFPFEENADVVFNSSTLYDVPLLKYYAEPLLAGIKESSPAYPKACSLLDFLKAVRPLTPLEIAAIPPTSIMREFIGGQTL